MAETYGDLSKLEILKWLNTTYKLNLTKIEQACTGAVYCQIIDSMYPNKVKMNKVNWKAKLEHEFTQNFKILQQAFNECKILKHIEVEKLTKGKYQDNLEFLQWLKKFFDENKMQYDYNPLSRRANQELEICKEIKSVNVNNSKPRSISPSVKLPIKNSGKENVSKTKLLENNLITIKEGCVDKIDKIEKNEKIDKVDKIEKTTTLDEVEIPVKANYPVEEVEASTTSVVNNQHIEDATDILRQHYQERLDISHDEIAKLKFEISTLKMSMSEIGMQRDFYFSKLRDIEMLATRPNNLDQNGLINIIKEILFSEKECELIFNENGNVNIKNFI